MPFAFIAAVGGVGLEDIAVASLQLFQYGGFVDYSGPTVIGDRRVRREELSLCHIVHRGRKTYEGLFGAMRQPVLR